MKGSKSTSQNRIRLITPISTLLYSLYILTIVFTPKYILNGIIQGEIALAYSMVKYYGEVLTLDSLSTIPILITPAIILSIYQIMISIITIIKMYRKRSVDEGEIKLLFAGGLTSIAISGLIIGLLKTMEIEVGKLDINLNYISSAGKIIFGKTIIQTISLIDMLTNQSIIIMATIIQITIITLAYIREL